MPTGWPGLRLCEGPVGWTCDVGSRPGPAATITNLIRGRCPERLQLPLALWTRESARELIAKRCDIEVSLSTVGRRLKRWGFTPQKPVRKAYERCPKAVQKWFDDEYPQIKAQAKTQCAEIHGGRPDGPA